MSLLRRESAGEAGELSLGMLPKLLSFHLRRTQMAVFQHLADSMGSVEDITPGLFGMLQVIAANPGLSQSRLAEAMGVDRSTIVKVISQLQRRGLVERIGAADDGRRYCLHPTPHGWTALRRMEAAVLAHEQAFTAVLSADERQMLISLLSRLHRQGMEENP